LLERWARGGRVRRVQVHDRRAIVGGGRALEALVKARFHRFERRGKHLLITLLHGHRPVGLWSLPLREAGPHRMFALARASGRGSG
jgi:formamidopyrimidine-DNA glycosylase